MKRMEERYPCILYRRGLIMGAGMMTLEDMVDFEAHGMTTRIVSPHVMDYWRGKCERGYGNRKASPSIMGVAWEPETRRDGYQEPYPVRFSKGH